VPSGLDPPQWPPEVPPWRPAPERREPRPVPERPSPLVPTVAVPAAAPHEDVFDRLLERRIVLVSGRLDDQAATSAAARLMLLDATGDEPVDLRLSCPDGDLDACIALADTVDLVGVTVRALCTGKVGGPALAPLAAADRRLTHPHCGFLLKDPSVQLHGRADELAASAASYQRQLDGLHTRLAQATGQPVERVEADMQVGRTLTAQEAVQYGLVEEIAGTSREG
jgi:ATP-dependent Clp protease protease subunit